MKFLYSSYAWSYGIASPKGSPCKLDGIKVPEVPEIANLLRLIFTSMGKLIKRFSQELIQDYGFLKPY